MKVHILAVAALVAMGTILSGCGAIESHRYLEQRTSTVLTTGIGGTIFRLNKTGDLPNAYGGRDIWGGKIDKGFAEIKLAGIEGDVLVLEVTDINKHSSETVMERYKPFQNRNAAINVDTGDTITVVGQDQKPHVIRFDTTKQKDIVISGVRVTFSDIQPYSIGYTLENVQP